MAKKFPLCPSPEIAHLTAALYSISQDCFHIEPLQDYVKLNLSDAFIKSSKGDYRLVGIFNSDTDADAYIDECRNNMKLLKEKQDKNISNLIDDALNSEDENT